MRARLIGACAGATLAAMWLWLPPAHGAIATSKHNLSVSGPGTVKATSESQICLFCHAPHNSSPNAPLWNHRASGSTYTPYTSSTAKAIVGQPTGASLLCLSCHDGTVALGDVLNRTTPIATTSATMPAGVTRLGTDLSDDHPVSFAYTSALASARGELVNPSTLTGRVKLDAAGQLQCTACHDPHDDINGKFLVMSNVASALCQMCHTKNYWTQSDHRNSVRTWNSVAPDPWPHTTGTTVAANACENCHRPHSAAGAKRLLNARNEEDNCYPCHNGNVAVKNVQSEFTSKASRHPVVTTTGVHDPAEANVVATRHVECVDCHNPHAAKAGTGTPSGPMIGVRGIGIGGTAVNPSTNEYQICLRCHGDSIGKPVSRTTRQIAQNNSRLEFQATNPSFHPVAAPGRSTNVPSLFGPWTVSSTMECHDCHNNNAGPGTGGTGPNGPHGSIYAPLLERQYVTTDNTSESPTVYALCYKCHSRTSILANATFREHNKHIVGERSPCNVCHDPHGISSTQGNSTNNSRLINFDTTVVTPSSSGALRFESLGTNRGRCYLTCHGTNHNPESY